MYVCAVASDTTDVRKCIQPDQTVFRKHLKLFKLFNYSNNIYFHLYYQYFKNDMIIK